MKQKKEKKKKRTNRKESRRKTKLKYKLKNLRHFKVLDWNEIDLWIMVERGKMWLHLKNLGICIINSLRKNYLAL